MEPMSKAADVQIFLMSRYGIKVSAQDVREIFFDLAGGDSDTDCIDIPEIVAILIVPFLRKIISMNSHTGSYVERTYISEFEREAFLRKQELRNLRASNVNIIDYVLKIIIQEATGSNDPQPLTKDLLRRIFTGYGEVELIQDEELLSEMISMAAGDQEGGAILDAQAFSRGLTDDITLYDLDKETRFSTHFEDVFGHSISKEDEPTSRDRVAETEGDGDDERTALSVVSSAEAEEDMKGVTEVFTFPQIDYLADTFRSKTQSVFVWVAALSLFVSYIRQFNGFGLTELCENGQSFKFGCDIGKYVLIWLVVFGLAL